MPAQYAIQEDNSRYWDEDTCTQGDCSNNVYPHSHYDLCMKHERNLLVDMMSRTRGDQHDEAKSDLAALMQWCEEEGVLCA